LLALLVELSVADVTLSKSGSSALGARHCDPPAASPTERLGIVATAADGADAPGLTGRLPCLLALMGRISDAAAAAAAPARREACGFGCIVRQGGALINTTRYK